MLNEIIYTNFLLIKSYDNSNSSFFFVVVVVVVVVNRHDIFLGKYKNDYLNESGKMAT